MAKVLARKLKIGGCPRGRLESVWRLFRSCLEIASKVSERAVFVFFTKIGAKQELL